MMEHTEEKLSAAPKLDGGSTEASPATCCSLPRRLAAAVLIALVRGYQIFLGPLLGGHCRFQPTCSVYFIEAVQKHGAWRGALRGLWRLCRCHPFCAGGYDPP